MQQGLSQRGVAVDNLVVNQLLGESADAAWVHRVAKAQVLHEKCIRLKLYGNAVYCTAYSLPVILKNSFSNLLPERF